MIYKALHRTQKVDQHEHRKKQMNSGALKGEAIPDPLLLLSRSLDVKQQSIDLATTLGRTCINIDYP